MPERWFGVLLAIYLALGVAYSLASPPFEPTDEMGHFRFIRDLAEERRLPILQPGDRTSEAHQPPLYYAAVAAVTGFLPADDLPEYFDRTNSYAGYRYWEVGADNKNRWLHGPWDAFPYHGAALAVMAARWVTLLMGAASLWLAFNFLRTWLPDRAALAATAFAAFNPAFLFTTASIQNEAGTVLIGSALLYLSARTLADGVTFRRALLWGVLLGLGWLTKLTGLFLTPGVLLVIAWTGARPSLPGRAWPRVLLAGALALGTATLLSGWWFLRNQLLYGDPTALRANFDVYGGQGLQDGLRIAPQLLAYAWTTAWGRFGHGEVPMPDDVYRTLAVLTLLALAGLIRWFWRRRARAQVPGALLWVAFVLSMLAGFMGYVLLSPTGGYARYVFPVLPALSGLLVAGFLEWFPSRWHGRLCGGIAVATFGLAVVALVAYLIPAYAVPSRVDEAVANLRAEPVHVNLGGTAEVLGYEVSAAGVRPGDAIDLTVYWKPLTPSATPLSVFVHLVSEDGALIAQRDTYPGLGRLPTTAWEPGRVFADTYRVLVPRDAPGALAHWKVGLWDAESGEHQFVHDASGEPIAEAATFGRVVVRP